MQPKKISRETCGGKKGSRGRGKELSVFTCSRGERGVSKGKKRAFSFVFNMGENCCTRWVKFPDKWQVLPEMKAAGKRGNFLIGEKSRTLGRRLGNFEAWELSQNSPSRGKCEEESGRPSFKKF